MFTLASSRSSGETAKPPTEEDLRVLSWQLGRPPRGVLAVKPCPYGFPQVILSYPLLRPFYCPLAPENGQETGEPMPTIFWLTCPYLVAEVAKLESAGSVKRYERLLATDEALARAYLSAHEAYKNERLSLLSPWDLQFAKAKGLRSLLESGIAGITNPTRVKCLHAQLAHHLFGRENPIGAMVAGELPQLFCPAERVLCSSAGPQ